MIPIISIAFRKYLKYGLLDISGLTPTIAFGNKINKLKISVHIPFYFDESKILEQVKKIETLENNLSLKEAVEEIYESIDKVK